MKKMLIVYYSWSNGNTKRIAELLQEKTDADIVRIDTVEPYKGSYNEVVNQGQEEVTRGYKPPIQKLDVCPGGMRKKLDAIKNKVDRAIDRVDNLEKAVGQHSYMVKDQKL